MTTETPPFWFTKACEMFAHDEEDALDIVYDNLDRLLKARSFRKINALMRYAADHAFDIPTDLLFGIITMTEHGRHFLSLSDRYHLYRATKRVVEARNEWEEGLFVGFTFSKPI